MTLVRHVAYPPPPNLTFVRLDRPTTSILDEVWAGLGADRKWLPARLFYDAAGARLFERISRTEAYYPTRSEIAILTAHAAAIAERVGRHVKVIEPGAGDMRKIRLLLTALRPAAYLPIDVSVEQLIAEARALAHQYAWLRVHAIAGDFNDPALVTSLRGAQGRALLFFPGSTIGNLHPHEAVAFLRHARSLLGAEAKALVGVDLVKDVEVLNRAYNDPEGYTAQFNLNVLARLNRELKTNFDLSAFEHRAFYDASLQRLEMHLVSRRAQSVRLGEQLIRFAPGESIHTENSYKYRGEQFAELAAQAGFPRAQCWQDPKGWFG